MSLRSTFDALLAQAQGGPPHTATRDLVGGARLTVRADGERVQLILARAGAPLGQVELATFQAHCGVPDDATRWPERGQSERDGWHRMAFTWVVPVPQPTFFDEV